MSVLDGFKLYRDDKNSIFVSVTAYGMTFSKAAVEYLDYVPYVHVYFDEEHKRFAVSPSKKDNDARVFVKDKNASRAGFVRWNDKKLINCLLKIGELELGENGIRVNGEYHNSEKVIIFDLNDYVPINGKNK